MIHDGVHQYIRRYEPAMREEIVRATISGDGIQALYNKSSLTDDEC
jgi:hypothetical protein